MYKPTGYSLPFWQFIRKSLFFLALLLAANECAGYLYVKLVSSYSYLFRTEAQFQGYKSDTKILVMGDSHPMSAVNPAFLENSFVLASQGENIIETYYRIKYYLEKEKLDIELVVLPVDAHTFAPISNDQFAPYGYWRKYINFVDLGVHRGRLFKFIRHRLEGECIYAGGIEDSIKALRIKLKHAPGHRVLIKGYMVRNTDFSQASDPVGSAKEKAEAYILGRDHFSPDTWNYFARMLELLNSHGVKVVLVRYPISYEYFNEVNKRMDISAYYQDLDKNLNKSGQIYPIFDYHDIYWDKPQYFSNSDHLNTTGAGEFTELLRSDLESLALIQ